MYIANDFLTYCQYEFGITGHVKLSTLFCGSHQLQARGGSKLVSIVLQKSVRYFRLLRNPQKGTLQIKISRTFRKGAHLEDPLFQKAVTIYPELN